MICTRVGHLQCLHFDPPCTLHITADDAVNWLTTFGSRCTWWQQHYGRQTFVAFDHDSRTVDWTDYINNQCSEKKKTSLDGSMDTWYEWITTTTSIEVPGYKRGTGRPRTNLNSTINKDPEYWKITPKNWFESNQNHYRKKWFKSNQNSKM